MLDCSYRTRCVTIETASHPLAQCIVIHQLVLRIMYVCVRSHMRVYSLGSAVQGVGGVGGRSGSSWDQDAGGTTEKGL